MTDTYVESNIITEAAELIILKAAKEGYSLDEFDEDDDLVVDTVKAVANGYFGNFPGEKTDWLEYLYPAALAFANAYLYRRLHEKAGDNE